MQFIENRISEFHDKRERKLRGLDLRDMLTHKNPYLFKAKNMLTAQDLIKGFLDGYLQMQEVPQWDHRRFGSVHLPVSASCRKRVKP